MTLGVKWHRRGEMGATTLISLGEYLSTTYEPDMEFVDGALVRRNVGTKLHSWLQSILVIYFGQFQKSHRIRVLTEARMLVDPPTGRHRIPDVMVLNTPLQRGSVIVDVPAIVVEIKSPDDTFDDLVGKCFDYEKMGVPNTIVMDPDNRRAWRFREGNLELFTGESVSLPIALDGTSALDLPFAAMFAELDEE
jgi:Uma2 family endonuclease